MQGLLLHVSVILTAESGMIAAAISMTLALKVRTTLQFYTFRILAINVNVFVFFLRLSPTTTVH